MCGIVGYIGNREAVPVIVDGLRRLEYRGYDSAGVAVFAEDGRLDIRRASGKLRNLEEVIRNKPLAGSYGIGHTRWATHGRPTEENAHPHRDCKGQIVVVHNGIVENYLALRKQLTAEGHQFVTETDTEIIAHLVEKHLSGNLEEAVRAALKEIYGGFRNRSDFEQRSAKDRGRALGATGSGRTWARTNFFGVRCARDSELYARHYFFERWRRGDLDG